jgi:hypothetical protein
MLHKMEEKLNAAETESQKIRDRAAADVVLYQKVCISLYIHHSFFQILPILFEDL